MFLAPRSPPITMPHSAAPSLSELMATDLARKRSSSSWILSSDAPEVPWRAGGLSSPSESSPAACVHALSKSLSRWTDSTQGEGPNTFQTRSPEKISNSGRNRGQRATAPGLFPCNTGWDLACKSATRTRLPKARKDTAAAPLLGRAAANASRPPTPPLRLVSYSPSSPKPLCRWSQLLFSPISLPSHKLHFLPSVASLP